MSLIFSVKEQCMEELERFGGMKERGPKMGCCLIIVLCGSQASSLPLQRSSPDLPCEGFIFKKCPLRSHTPHFSLSQIQSSPSPLPENRRAAAPQAVMRTVHDNSRRLLGAPPVPWVTQPLPIS